MLVLADLLSLFYGLRASACDQQSDNHIAKKVRLTCDDVVINRDNAHVYKKKLALCGSAKTMKEISVGLGMSSELGEGLALGMGRGMGYGRIGSGVGMFTVVFLQCCVPVLLLLQYYIRWNIASDMYNT